MKVFQTKEAADNAPMEFTIKNIRRGTWAKFKEICKKNGEWPSNRLRRMIEEEVANYQGGYDE